MTFIFRLIIAVVLAWPVYADAGKATPLISSFNAGELSPKLDIRIDLEKYFSGCRTLENMIPLVEGATSRAPGTYFVLETKDSSLQSRLIPFEFSTIQSYVIEAGDKYFRFYKDDGQIRGADDYTMLMIHFDGTDESTSFFDDSTNNHTLDKVGNVEVDTAWKKFGSGSGLFDGDGDYLEIADSSDFDFSNDYIVLETYVRFPTISGLHSLYAQTSAASSFVLFYVDLGLSKINFLVTESGATTIDESISWSPVADTGYHIALIRGWGGVTTAWAVTVDGFAQGTFTSSADIPDFTSTVLIGSSGTTIAPDSGVSRHGVNFIATAGVTTEGYFDGAAWFDGDSDYLYLPDSNVWDVIGSGVTEWTVDLWVKFTDHAGTENLIGQAEDANNRWFFQHVHGSGLRFANGAGSLDTGFAGEITDTDWHHVMVYRLGVVYGVYKDGSQTDYLSDNTTDTFAGPLVIGARQQQDVPANLFSGYKDEIRIVQGNPFSLAPSSGVTDTYTVPTSAYTSDSDTKLLLHLDSMDLNGWLDEYRLTSGVTRWTSNFTPPTQAYPFTDSGTLTGGGDATLEVVTPYTAENVMDLKTAQSADRLYIFHPSYPPKTLTRSSHYSWTLADMKTNAGTLLTITGISNANPAVVTCAAVPTTLEDGEIVYISGTTTMPEVSNKFFDIDSVDTGAKTFELEGINSTNYSTFAGFGYAQEQIYGTEDNRPSCGAFFEQRLAIGGSNNNPQQVNLSESGDYDEFTGGVSDDDAIQYTIASGQIDRVLWMLGQDYLLMGTVGGIWRLGATTIDDPITPTNILARKQISLGVKDIEPEVVTDSILWVTRAGTSVRQLKQSEFAYATDKFVSPDVTRIAKHITYGSTRLRSGIAQLAFQQEPLPILWAIRADGQLLGMTYENQEEIYSWFRIKTDGEFESVAVNHQEDNEDRVWVIANRTIDGSTKRYVEYFKPIEFFSKIEDAFFLHSGLTWDGGTPVAITGISGASPAVVSASGHGFEDGDEVRVYDVSGMTEINIGTDDIYTVTLSSATQFALAGVDSSGYSAYTSGGTTYKCTNDLVGLGHLSGKTVAILSDGVVQDNELVANSGVSIEVYANKIHVGLPYTSIVEPMKINAGSELGPARGKKQRIYKLFVSFFETGDGIQYGPTRDDLQSFADFTSGELLTDQIKVDGLQWDFEDEATISIVQEQPLPMTILGIIPWVTLSED